MQFCWGIVWAQVWTELVLLFFLSLIYYSFVLSLQTCWGGAAVLSASAGPFLEPDPRWKPRWAEVGRSFMAFWGACHFRLEEPWSFPVVCVGVGGCVGVKNRREGEKTERRNLGSKPLGFYWSQNSFSQSSAATLRMSHKRTDRIHNSSVFH